MAPQRLEKIESAPGNGMGSEASNLQDLVRARADRARLRLTGRENALQLFAAKCLLQGYWKLFLDFIGSRGLKLKIRIKMPVPKKSSCFLLHASV
jgi:hypothetical protein